MKKKEQLDFLSECILVELSAECENCRKLEGAVFCDEDDFAKDLYDKGWRIVKGQCLCQKCVKTVKK